MIATRLYRAMALAGAGIVWSAVPAVHAAEAAQPACGSVVTTNVQLTADLVCSGDGLIVDGAGSVTIDLGGFSLSGDGTGTGIAIRKSTAVLVRDGVVNEFRTAVSAASPATLVDLGFSGNTAAPRPFSETASDLVATAPVVARRLTGTGSVFAGFHTGSVFNHVSFDSLSTILARGMEISNSEIRTISSRDSAYFRIFRNVIGVESVNQSDGFEFRDNVMTRLAVGQSRGTAVIDNVFRHSDNAALSFRPYGAAANLIAGNLFEGNDVGLLLDTDADTTVTHNRFRDNRSAGLYVIARHGNVSVSENTLSANGAASSRVDAAGSPVDDGMHVVVVGTSATVTITGNKASRNADLGIEATGAIDGGGNTARRNGNPAQCTGVACS